MEMYSVRNQEADTHEENDDEECSANLSCVFYG
jgi:hypothetical protein